MERYQPATRKSHCCEFWAGYIMGSYIFENDVRQAITLNGKY